MKTEIINMHYCAPRNSYIPYPQIACSYHKKFNTDSSYDFLAEYDLVNKKILNLEQIETLDNRAK